MKPRDRVLETLPTHEPHRVERPSIRMMAQAVHRYDSRMLQTAGDLHFEQKARERLSFTGVSVLDRFESPLAVQLFVKRHGNDTQATLSMGPENAEPPSRRGGAAQVAECRLRVSPREGNVRQARLEFRIGHP